LLTALEFDLMFAGRLDLDRYLNRGSLLAVHLAAITARKICELNVLKFAR